MSGRQCFMIFMFGLFLLTGCKETSKQDEKTSLLLAEIGKQQTALAEQIKANGEAIKRLEEQNLRIQKLLERQQAFQRRRMGRDNRPMPSSEERLGRIISGMSRKLPPSEIAEFLNRKKLDSPDGKAWTEESVKEFLEKEKKSPPKLEK